MKHDHTVVVSITLYPSDVLLARQVAEHVGSRSISAGLRAIIAEYRRFKEQPQPAPSQGG